MGGGGMPVWCLSEGFSPSKPKRERSQVRFGHRKRTSQPESNYADDEYESQLQIQRRLIVSDKSSTIICYRRILIQCW
jgi:hypothetical protein